uniref:Uncharacterized protein n=1 Tax=Wuchereria bancrofti TaxID=6293 RepID=A0A1I8ECV5_WUCBA
MLIYWRQIFDINLALKQIFSISLQVHLRQICTEFPLCTTFVVRGCMEQISTTKLRIDRKFQKKGCYIVRSKRFYPTLALLSYIICVCFIEYCNCDMQKSFLHKNQSESDSISLVSTVEDERLARAEIHGLATALNSFITCTCCESAFCECSTQ